MKRIRKTLNLSVETIRVLTDHALSHVIGGLPDESDGCQSRHATNCTMCPWPPPPPPTEE